MVSNNGKECVCDQVSLMKATAGSLYFEDCFWWCFDCFSYFPHRVSGFICMKSIMMTHSHGAEV